MNKAIEFFESENIPVLKRGQSEYEQAIATSNLFYRFSRPECVVRPKSAVHVQKIIKEAKSRGIRVTIKCNGHSYAGHSTAFQVPSASSVTLPTFSPTFYYHSGHLAGSQEHEQCPARHHFEDRFH